MTTGGLRKLTRVVSFGGRAGRKEFAAIATPLIVFEVAVIWLGEALELQTMPAPWFGLVIFLILAPIALIAPVVLRRLHDIGQSGIWIFLFGTAANVASALVVWAGLPEAENPVLAATIGAGLLYLAAARGNPGDNRFGPAP